MMSTTFKRIIWLASYPKSGNTWFRIFLDNLLSRSDAPSDINKIYSSISASNRTLFDRFIGHNTSDLTYQEIDILRPKVYKMLACERNDQTFIKTHDSWQKNSIGIPLFPKEVTKAVLYFIRNPLDVIISFAFHGNISFSKSLCNLNSENFGLCNNQTVLYNQIHQVLNDWSNHVISWTENSDLPVHVVRYEDIISNATKEFTNCLDFIDMDYNMTEVKKALSNSSFHILQDQERKSGFREKELNAKTFFRKGAIGEWRSYLSKEQVKIIYNKHKSIMNKYGYYTN